MQAIPFPQMIDARQAYTDFEQLYSIEKADWVWYPDWKNGTQSIVIFENTAQLKTESTIRIHISADQRYELFINNTIIGLGPDRCDVQHWMFRSYQVTLPAGVHHFRVEVQWLPETPTAQLTYRPGFIFAAEGEHAAQLNTGSGNWLATDRSDAWSFSDHPYTQQKMVGKSQHVHSVLLQQERSPVCPEIICRPSSVAEWGCVRDHWKLIPSQLSDQYIAQHSPGLCKAYMDHAFDIDTPITDQNIQDPQIDAVNKLLHDGIALDIPANQDISFIWHLENYYCAYSLLEIGASTGATISLCWFEAAYAGALDPARANGSHPQGAGKIRDPKDWAGCHIRGLTDSFDSHPSQKLELRSSWFRSGTAIHVRIQTQDEPLTLHKLGIRETRYPLEQETSFDSDDASLENIFPLCERVMQMCSHETYYDCPHFEQLMYVADTQVIMQTARSMSADRRLTHQCIRLYDYSKLFNGTINCAYPSGQQAIPTFPLYWVMMLHDSLLWDQENSFLPSLLISMHQVMGHFEQYINEDDLLANPPGWCFIDPAVDWQDDIFCPPGNPTAVLNFFYARVLKQAAAISNHFGQNLHGEYYTTLAERIIAAAKNHFYDRASGMIYDNTTKNSSSEHAYVLAILGDVFAGDERQQVWYNLRTQSNLSRCATFWKYYLFEAYHKVGEADLLFNELDDWQRWHDEGFYTTPEMHDPTRSDCHAWGAHPLFHLRASIAGIRPASAGFKTVHIEPCLGHLTNLHCQWPHHSGMIDVDYEREGDALTANITLPDGLCGSFHWHGENFELQAGENKIQTGNK